MSITEGLRNLIHREVQRVLDRRSRRTPCIVDSYDGTTHRVKVKLQPEGTLSGWMQIETATIGLLIAPNIGDPGWIEFHENDRRAGVFVASAHNNAKPPPLKISAGEFFYQQPGTNSSLYIKNDGSVTWTDKAGTIIQGDGQGNANVTASTAVTINAPAINLGPSGQAPHKLVTDAMIALFNTHSHPNNGEPPTQQMTSEQTTSAVGGF